MSECKQKYIEWSSENGSYCGEYEDGRLIGTDASLEFDGWKGAWNQQQLKIDELKHQKSLQELAINQISQANQEWRSINYEQQKRIGALSKRLNEAISIVVDDLEEFMRGEK